MNISDDGCVAARLEVLPIGTVVLVVRSGVLAHTLPAAVLSKPATINQDIKALTVRVGVEPKFLSYYLSIHQNLILPLVRKHGETVHSVNTPELLKLAIPIPPLEDQRQLVAELDTARVQRDHALEDAEQILSSIDIMVKELLGLPALEIPTLTGYAVSSAMTKDSNTLSAEYYHPERMQAIRLIQSLPNAPLSQLVSFKRNVIKTPGEARYIGLASVACNTGQLLDVTETATGQGFKFNQGDVLYGRLRPYLNKVWFAGFEGVCSMEFHVMEPFDTEMLRPEYLAVVMRTSLIVAQTKHMMTGNTHPRIANEDVAKLLLPLTDPSKQALIGEETLRKQAESVRLRDRAETIWREARERFEQQLLKGDNS